MPGIGVPETLHGTSFTVVPYPCDRGTGTPMGWHSFTGTPEGMVVCTYCGRQPALRNPERGRDEKEGK